MFSQLPIYLAAFVAAIAVLVVIHELGHYAVARFFDVKVLRFSFGFGRVVWMRRYGSDGTEWAVCAIPLGGYVKMLDEREAAVETTEVARAFNRQTVGRRALIVAAGPVANFVLAVLLYTVVFINGVFEFRPVLGEPPADSPAARAGVIANSEVLALNGRAVTSWQDVRWQLLRELLDRERVQLTLRLPDGAVELREIEVPAGLGNKPEQDALHALGLHLPALRIEPVIDRIVRDSPAQAIGLLPGDRVMFVDGERVSDWETFAAHIRRSPGMRVLLDVDRNGKFLRFAVVPTAVESDGLRVGRLGISPRLPQLGDDPRAMLVRSAPFSAAYKAVRQTWETAVLTVRMIGRMIVGQMSWKNVSGPVTMADYAGQSAQYGLDAYLRFLALISISLGVLNLLPIPILDGGHLLYYLIEACTGKPLPEPVLDFAQRVGMALLALLMVFAFYNDINRLVSG